MEDTAAALLRRGLMEQKWREMYREGEAKAKAAGYTSEDQILREFS